MGPGVLTLLWAGSAFAVGSDTAHSVLAIADSGGVPGLIAPTAPPDSGRSKDTAKGPRVRVPLPKPWSDTTPAWPIPVRAGSAGWALDQAFRDGVQDVPWRRNFEFDGMWESWQPWTGLPLEERPARLSWDGPSLAGAGDAGPLSGMALEPTTTPGFGGVPVRWIRPDSLPSDTPSTSLHFFRDALASYRFGFEFGRAVWGPWGISVGMETRSAQAVPWLYRDQIQDLFQGSFGRLRQDLPAAGQGPGQDDAQWQAVVTRGGADSRLDIGWTWTDLRRGVPDPTGVWGGTALPPLPGDDSRSGFFARWIGQADLLRVETSLRIVQEQWSWWSWADSGAPVAAFGDQQREDATGRIRWGDDSWGLGVEGSGKILTGSRIVPLLAVDVNEDEERGGAFAQTRLGSFHAQAGAGWTRLSSSENAVHGDWDARSGVEWTDSVLSGRLQYSRAVKLPDEDVERPDPLLETFPAPGLLPELRDLVELRASVRPLRGWTLDAAGAILAIHQAIQPLDAPTSADSVVARDLGMELANAGRVLGCSGQVGAGWAGKTLRARTEWALGWTGLPDQPLDGQRDPRLPQWQSRSNIGWSHDALGGRMQVGIDADLRTWGESWSWVGIASDANAHAVRLPASSETDLEFRVGIKSFVIDWWLENIFDERQTPAPGWTPLGIHAGWGITWNFGG